MGEERREGRREREKGSSRDAAVLGTRYYLTVVVYLRWALGTGHWALNHGERGGP
jgi:hypothetical protein